MFGIGKLGNLGANKFNGGSSAFLPNAGPFTLGFDSIPVGPNVNTLSNLTLSANANIPTNRRKTMLKYNHLTINAGKTWTSSSSDMCLMTWSNRILVNGSINTSGGNGQDGFNNAGGAGGNGAAGGGGGGGGLQCASACCGGTPGAGGNGSSLGGNGENGGDSIFLCSPYSSGGIGGTGVGLANWGDASDGYDYAGQLGLNPESSGQPFAFGGFGSAGNNQGGGGAGGGSGGIQIYVCNSISAGPSGSLVSNGGDPGLNEDTASMSAGGDGGCIAILVRAGGYDGSLNGKVSVTAGLNGNTDGSATIWRINPNNSFDQMSFAVAF